MKKYNFLICLILLCFVFGFRGKPFVKVQYLYLAPVTHLNKLSPSDIAICKNYFYEECMPVVKIFRTGNVPAKYKIFEDENLPRHYFYTFIVPLFKDFSSAELPNPFMDKESAKQYFHNLVFLLINKFSLSNMLLEENKNDFNETVEVLEIFLEIYYPILQKEFEEMLNMLKKILKPFERKEVKIRNKEVVSNLGLATEKAIAVGTRKIGEILEAYRERKIKELEDVSVAPLLDAACSQEMVPIQTAI